MVPYEKRNRDVCKPVLSCSQCLDSGTETANVQRELKSKASGQVIELNVVMDTGSRRPRVNSDEARRCDKDLVFIIVLQFQLSCESIWTSGKFPIHTVHTLQFACIHTVRVHIYMYSWKGRQWHAVTQRKKIKQNKAKPKARGLSACETEKGGKKRATKALVIIL